MSRLEKVQKKQIKRYAILLTIFLGLAIFLGPKLLINTGVFIAELGRDKNSKDADLSDKFIEAPEIFDIPDATNSATLKITGRAPEGDVTIFVNGDDQKEITSEGDDFETIIILDEGDNEIYLQSENKKTLQKKKSAIYKVSFISTKPTLEVTSPKSGDKVGKDEIQVTGATDPNITIHVNGAPTVVNGKGEFSSSVRLSVGENKIKVEAIDNAGNITMNEITVIYERDE